MLYGAITFREDNFVCVISNKDLEIADKLILSIDTPAKNMSSIVNFFKKFKNLKSLGVEKSIPTYVKNFLNSNKTVTSEFIIKWQKFNFFEYLERHLNSIYINLITDVNAACYGEYIKGIAKSVSKIVYYKFDNDISGSALFNGQFIKESKNPNVGHTFIQRHSDDFYTGSCPYHNDCLEGLASGKSFKLRLQRLDSVSAQQNIEAYYIAQCLYNITVTFSPELIILDGNIIKDNYIMKKTLQQFDKLSNSYLDYRDLSTYIVKPQLKENAAEIGCLALAKDLYVKNVINDYLY